MNNKKQLEKKQSFWKWFHKNRTKIALSAFIIVIPLALIFTAYYGAYTSNRRVFFDSEPTSQTVYINHFVEKDEINELTLHIEWTALKNPTLNDDELVGGYYDFSVYYTANQNFIVSNVSIIPVLQTPWTNIRSIGSQTPLTQSVTYIRIAFDYELPVTPLWFVRVDEANLYLKVNYTVQLQNYNVDKVAYVIYRLGDVSPKPVVG